MPNPEDIQPTPSEVALRESLGLLPEPPLETLLAILGPFAGKGIERLNTDWLTSLKKGFSLEASWRALTLELVFLPHSPFVLSAESIAESGGVTIEPAVIWGRIRDQAWPGTHWTVEGLTALAKEVCDAQSKGQPDIFVLGRQRLIALTVSLLEKENLPGLREAIREQRAENFRHRALYSPDWLRALIFIEPVNSWDGRLLVEALAIDNPFLVKSVKNEIIHRFKMTGGEEKGRNVDRVRMILGATQYEWRFDPTPLIKPMVELMTDGEENLSLFGKFFNLIKGETLINGLKTKLLTLADDRVINERLKERLLKKLELAMAETEIEEGKDELL